MTKKPFPFVDLRTFCPDLIFDIRYATKNNCFGLCLYSTPDCFLHLDTARKIQKAQKDFLSLDVSLKVFDGYRPISVQQKAWDFIQDERYVSNPSKNKGRHTRGTAIDVTLVDKKTRKELTMPTEFDAFIEKAHSDHKEGISEEALKNRALLNDILKKNGFIQLPTEWWHFDLIGWEDDERYPARNDSFEEMKKKMKEQTNNFTISS